MSLSVILLVEALSKRCEALPLKSRISHYLLFHSTLLFDAFCSTSTLHK